MKLTNNKLAAAVKLGLVTGVATVAFAGVASAQTTNPDETDRTSDSNSASAKSVGKVTVTGSRLKRAEVEGALPVTVISRDVLDKSGKASVTEYLRDTNFNSFGSYQSTSGSSGGGAALANLRGLGSGRTLILIDGRRAPNAPMLGSGQDLNSIPLAAVERIEILTDGASSIYGSDAIGGVINVITRRDYQGMEVTVGKTIPTQPGGDGEEFSVLLGASGERARFLGGASHTFRDIIFTRDRDYWMSAPGTSTFSNNMATGAVFNATSRLQHPTYGAAVPGLCTNGDDTDLFYMSGTTAANKTCQYNHSMISAQLTSAKADSMFLRGDVQINDNWTVYGNGSVTRTNAFGRFAPVPSSPWPGGAIVLKPGSKNHPGTIGGNNPLAADPYYQGLANRTLYLFHRFAALGARDGDTTNTTASFIGGVEGRIWDKVDVDFGVRYVQSKALNLGTNYVVGGLAQNAIDSGAYNIYNPFAGDPTKLGFTATISRNMKTSIKEAFANASFDLFQLPGGTASAAVGVEGRSEYYQDIYDPLSESGQIVGSAGNSAGGSRTVHAAYFEVGMPVLKSLELNVSGRYDQYSDYGNDFSPKVSFRWHPMDSLTFRGSYGKGFRAPPLSILTQKTAFSATATTDPATCQLLAGRPDCNTQVTTYSISNPNLSSEKSTQWSLGGVWDPTTWMSLTLDYWNIKIDDQITSTTLATVVRCLRGQPGLCPSGLVQFPDGTVLPNESLGVGASFDRNNVNGAITGAQLGSVNLGYFEAAGWDATARTRFNIGGGRLQNMFSVSKYTKYAANGGATALDSISVPVYRAQLVNNYTIGDWDFNYNISHIHGTENNAGDGRLPSWNIQNAQVSYNTPWNGKVTVGVNNIANKDPVFDPRNGGTSYDYYLYDPWGRQVYMRYTQRF